MDFELKEKGLFVDGSFRTIGISYKKGIMALIGKLKEDPQGDTIAQKYIFDERVWTEDKVKGWVKENKGKTLLLKSLVHL